MLAGEPVWLGLSEGTWIAIVALVLASMVSVIATLAAFLTSRRERAHARLMAQDQRQQERRYAAYTDLATHLSRIAEWTRRTEGAEYQNEPAMPANVEPEALRRLIAMAHLVGSPDVRNLLDSLAKANVNFQAKAWHKMCVDNAQRGVFTFDESQGAWEEVRAARMAVYEQIQLLRTAMRQDLGNSPGDTLEESDWAPSPAAFGRLIAPEPDDAPAGGS